MRGGRDARRPRAAMFRIFHFSDTHLGHQQYPRTDAEGLNQREQDLYAAFHRVVDAAAAERPDLVVHAGDLFDGVRPGNRALAHALEGFVRLSRAGIPVVAIAGNHEHPKMRETGSPFRLLEHLEHVHPVYRGRRETVRLQARDGSPVRVHAVPQCQDGNALARAVDEAETEGEGHDILVVHGAVHGLDAFRNAEFNELTLDRGWFTERFSYVALGHFHGVHEVTERAWYCGAPERVSMAESGEEKGFLDVVLPPRPEGGSRPLPQVRFRPLPGRPYSDLPLLDASGLDVAGVEAEAEGAVARVPAGAVVRLRIAHLDASLRGGLDPRRLRALAPQALHLDLRLEWTDTSRAVRGAPEIGPLADEFERFAAQHPMEGLERGRLLERARAVLRDEEGTPGEDSGAAAGVDREERAEDPMRTREAAA